MAISPKRRGSKRTRNRARQANRPAQNPAWNVWAVNVLVAAQACVAAPVHIPQMPSGPASFLMAVLFSALVVWLNTYGLPTGR